MKFENNKVSEIKIAYVGGGSRGWAWGLMSDLASCNDISGDVYLYDIDFEAACDNEIIGNKFNNAENAKTVWNYHAVKTAKEAMTDADFVIISILPGTFDEMHSDVHTPEKYGIYQSVGDTSGSGGIVRAMRTVPMYEEIARFVKEYCPNAWVISYTNPMTLCIKTLYRTFPEIKAFGCCHEVFGTQKVLMTALEEICGIKDVKRDDIKVPPKNMGQITNLPLGAVVETNAVFRSDSVIPVMSGAIPESIYPLVSRTCAEQEAVHTAITNRDVEGIFAAFANDPLVTIDMQNARKLFDEMVENTKKYLSMYNI